MKTVRLIFLTIGLLAMYSCNKKTDVNTMLKNSETRTEIFKSIANNQEFMTEFMEDMQSSDHAIQMMQGNRKLMGNMMEGPGMQMMMKDSLMMKNMMQGMMGNMEGHQSMMKEMMKDGKMMGKMMKMMHEKGMMSEDCMQSSMKMMGDKGMDMNGINKMKK